MKKRFTNFTLKIRLIIASLVLIAIPFINVTQASAAQITGRTMTLSSSVGGATGVTYTLTTAALPSVTHVLSAQVQFCTTTTACPGSGPTGFSSASVPTTPVTQPTGLGVSSGWSSNEAVANDLRVTIATNASAPSGSVTIPWTNVTNPTATNTTFYALITTYSDAAWTTPIDTGIVALSTSAQIQVALTVSEALTFCTGTTITGQNCGTISGTSVNLGAGSTTATASGTSVMAASTNGATGYSIVASGTTLTNTVGGATIAALTGGGTSTIGSAQFGFNLAGSNTTPAVGAAVSGTGSGAATTNYGINNTFRFNPAGESVASATVPTNANTFTVGYIANIAGTTPPGTYNANLTYTATANF